MSPQWDITWGCPGEWGGRPDENTFRVDATSINQSQTSPSTAKERGNSRNSQPLSDAVTDLGPCISLSDAKIAFPSMRPSFYLHIVRGDLCAAKRKRKCRNTMEALHLSLKINRVRVQLSGNHGIILILMHPALFSVNNTFILSGLKKEVTFIACFCSHQQSSRLFLYVHK